MYCSALIPCFSDHFFFVSDFRQLPCQYFPEFFPFLSTATLASGIFITCKRGEIVHCDEGPVGGVAQVVCHGVIVVAGHQEEGQEEEGEKQGEVEGEVEKLKDNRTSWMVWRWGERQVRTALSLEPWRVW